MTHAYDFGRLIKRGFYLSPDMVANGNFGSVMPPKRKKKKKKTVVDNNDEPELPKQQSGTLSAKSAAYLFGAWMKQAQNPGQSTTGPITTNPGGTLSLNNPSFSPSVIVSGGTQGPNLGPSNPTGYKPNAPRTAWQEFWNPPYKSHTGLGTYVDVLDRWYNPWTTQNNYEKGEKGLMRAGQAAMGVGATAAAAAGAIAAAPTVAGMVGGGGTAAGGTAAGGAAAASQTPAGQNFIQRAGQFANTAATTAGNLAQQYQTRVAPTLERLNYKPQDVLQDAYAVGTGHLDHVKGPGWGFATPSMPVGAPSFPRPLEAWKQMYGIGAGMLPGGETQGTANLARAGM